MKISVIMPSYLSPYSYVTEKGFIIYSARNQEEKFKRAVNSFLAQTYEDKELIVVSDGCEKTISILAKEYDNSTKFINTPEYSNNINNELIKAVYIDKQPMFSGKVRQVGIENSSLSSKIICYLDTDDFLEVNHLKTIADNFKGKWVYYNDFIYKDPKNPNRFIREVKPEFGSIGTSSIAHLKNIKFKWEDGYNHDWKSIKKYLLSLENNKIIMPEYYVCHVSAWGIDN
jgi:glycosyltransferase involved in cell wall biosynthesis